MNLYTSHNTYAGKILQAQPTAPFLLPACLPGTPLQLKGSTPSLPPLPVVPNTEYLIVWGWFLPIQDPKKPLIMAKNRRASQRRAIPVIHTSEVIGASPTLTCWALSHIATKPCRQKSTQRSFCNQPWELKGTSHWWLASWLPIHLETSLSLTDSRR